METKLNIAEILKDKPKGTKLHSPLFGKCTFLNIYDSQIYISHHTDTVSSFYSNGTYFEFSEAEPLLFPSKEMRDWAKFSWKKGDLLINSCGFQCIFKEWTSDDYTKFNGCYSNSRDGYEDVSNEKTSNFVKLDNNIAYGYIRELEKRLGGKLNRETLKIEKQTEFKDGDIITFKDRIIIIYNTSIEKSPKRTEIYYHACLKEGELTVNEYLMSYGFGEGWYSSTEEEKQQLFDALAKKGKAWDAEKKEVVDLKPKIELKPFDKVLVRDSKSDYWRATLFSHINENGCYYCVWASWTYCIPYEGNEYLLGTNKDVEG